MMQRMQIKSALLIALLLISCSSSGDDVKEVKVIVSWAGMIRMIGEEYLQHRITLRYSSTALKSAIQDLEKERQKLAKAHAPAEAVTESTKLGSIAGEMKSAIEQDDSAKLTKNIQEAVELQEKLREILHRVETRK